MTAFIYRLFITIAIFCDRYFSLAEITLSITAKTYVMELYVDGEYKILTSDGQWSTSDNLTLEDDNRLIAVVAGDFTASCPGLLGSVTNDYLVTNGSWKCTSTFYDKWNTLGYDDSKWNDTYVIGPNGNVTSPPQCTILGGVSGISPNAYWIWTTSLVNEPTYDTPIYCRGYLSICELYSPCLNGATCNTNDIAICSCSPEYTGTYCETEKRNYLTITSHDSLSEVYIDGVKSTLQNGNNINSTDVIAIAPLTRLISVMAISRMDNCAALIAYVTQSPIITDASWKCSSYASDEWSQLGFDDSSWQPAFVLGNNGNVSQCQNLIFISAISADANWIWTEYEKLQPEKADKAVFCRVYIAACQSSSPCQNGGTCLDNSKDLCKCTPEWAGTFCDEVNNPCFYEPCMNNGTCVVISNRYECLCLPGHVGINCEKIVPDRNLTITAKQTLSSVYVDNFLQDLTFQSEWNISDVVRLSTEIRLIAIMATDLTKTCAGILASITGDYLVTDATWKCNQTVTGFPENWYQLGYDDSSWKNAYIIGINGNVTTPAACTPVTKIPSISSNAFWIWTNSMIEAPNYDEIIYCRGYLPTCQFDNPCRNGGTCNRNSALLCTCQPGFTGRYCDSVFNRTLTITAKSTLLGLYADGVQVIIPNSDNVNLTDDVSLPPFSRLIATIALDATNTCPGILGSVTEDYLVTDARWKCVPDEQVGWNTFGFDDSLWPQAYLIGENGGQMVFPECSVLPGLPSISETAVWIWTNFSVDISQYHSLIYCRAYLPLCTADNPCYNGGRCNSNSATLCTCLLGFSGNFCEIEETKTLALSAETSLNAAYVDGIQIELRYGEISSMADNVTVKALSRLVAIMAVKPSGTCPGLIASIDDGGEYLLTGSHWRCSSEAKFGWFELGFNDTTWSSAVAIRTNDDEDGIPCPELPQVPGISPNASWIWTGGLLFPHITVYCRGYLPACSLSPCVNGGTCNSNSPAMCTCLPGYTGDRCEQIQSF